MTVVKYRGLIIGAGAAGVQRPDGNHADCFIAHERCSISGIYDPSAEARQKATRKTGAPVFEDLGSALKTAPDIVSLAVHPEHRSGLLEQVLATPSVKALFCEKPLGSTADEAADFVRRCHQAGKRVYINYQRRGNPTYQRLRRELAEGSRGPLQNVNFYYTRGLRSNACHWVDLSLMLFGAPHWVYGVKSPIAHPYPQDPNYTILLGHEGFHTHFIPLLSSEHGFLTGDLELTFAKERLFIPNITHYKTHHSRRWVEKGGILEEVPTDIEIHHGASNDFRGLFDILVADLDRGGPESLNPWEAVWSVEILDLVEESARRHMRMDYDKNARHHSGKDGFHPAAR